MDEALTHAKIEAADLIMDGQAWGRERPIWGLLPQGMDNRPEHDMWDDVGD